LVTKRWYRVCSMGGHGWSGREENSGYIGSRQHGRDTHQAAHPGSPRRPASCHQGERRKGRRDHGREASGSSAEALRARQL